MPSKTYRALRYTAVSALFDQENILNHSQHIGQVVGHVIGQVVALTNASGAACIPSLQAIAGVGLAGERHADPLSPRQVLLAGADAYARHALAPHALGENLLLDGDTASLRSGQLLQVGAQAVLWLSFHCEACGQLDRMQAGLAQRIGLHGDRRRGMLARVLHGGVIKLGDAIVLLSATLPGWSGWSDDWRERVAAVLARVPDGMVVDYRQLARLAGLQTAYCRVFPKIARELGLAHKAVATTSAPGLPRWQGFELFDYVGQRTVGLPAQA